MDEIKKIPKEWATEMGYTILDPDGWRGSYADKSFDEPLTKEEFLPRLWISTIGPLNYGQ